MFNFLMKDSFYNAGIIVVYMSNIKKKNQPDVTGNSDTSSPHLEYETIIELYHKKVFNLILRIMVNYEEAGDLTQEVFIRAYKSYPRFIGSVDDVYPWLCKIAVNICCDKIKALSKQNLHEVVSLDKPIRPDISQQGMEISDSTYDPEGIFQSKVMDEIIRNAIDRLPDEYRLVVVLRDIQGLTYKEISEVAGISIEIVKIRIHRAREILRRQLESYLK